MLCIINYIFFLFYIFDNYLLYFIKSYIEVHETQVDQNQETNISSTTLLLNQSSKVEDSTIMIERPLMKNQQEFRVRPFLVYI